MLSLVGHRPRVVGCRRDGLPQRLLHDAMVEAALSAVRAARSRTKRAWAVRLLRHAVGVWAAALRVMLRHLVQRVRKRRLVAKDGVVVVVLVVMVMVLAGHRRWRPWRRVNVHGDRARLVVCVVISVRMRRRALATRGQAVGWWHRGAGDLLLRLRLRLRLLL